MSADFSQNISDRLNALGFNVSRSMPPRGLGTFLAGLVDDIVVGKVSFAAAAAVLENIIYELSFFIERYSYEPPEGTASVANYFLEAVLLLHSGSQELLEKLFLEKTFCPDELEPMREMFVEASQILAGIGEISKIRDFELRKDLSDGA